jgi:hypothetical protein
MLTPFTHTTISSFSSNITSLWLIDSATSNHMTDSPTTLHDVCKYDGKQHIQITDGCTLPITVVGNLGSSFTNVFVSPDLSVNLIPVGQLVEKKLLLLFWLFCAGSNVGIRDSKRA